jgi:tetratricopeptide (TPR) repeat protein
MAERSYRRHEALSSFALLKPVEKLTPEDFGFQVMRPGDRPDTYKRPFYRTYISRSASEVSDVKVYTDAELVEVLREGKGLVLLGQPLDGKSRTLYEIVGRMDEYRVVRPSPSKGLPRDEDFSLLDGERVILLLEDLHNYMGRQVDLLEFYQKLGDHASSCVVASTCRDGPEQKIVETNLARFYEEIDLKLRLVPPTTQDKGRLAESIGGDWDPEKSDDYPTLGSITMERPMEAMTLRFKKLAHERPHVADTLRTLKLLSAAAILPFTYRRIETVLEQLFGRREIHLGDYLSALANGSFLQDWEQHQGTVRPEPAYLRDAVTYTVGKSPQDDFPKLADVLEDMDDSEGLFYLGVTYNEEEDYEQALTCFDTSLQIKANFPAAWYNKGVVLSTLGNNEAALEAYEEALRLGLDLPEVWNNKGVTLANLGHYGEAVEAFDKALRLKTDHVPSLLGKGKTLGHLGCYEEALEACNKALQLWPKYIDALICRAVSLENLERYEEALDAINDILELQPGRVTALISKGTLLSKRKCYEEAIEAYDRALTYAPDSPHAFLGKGIALAALGRHDEAAKQLCQAWKARQRFSDDGAQVAEELRKIGCDPILCG